MRCDRAAGERRKCSRRHRIQRRIDVPAMTTECRPRGSNTPTTCHSGLVCTMYTVHDSHHRSVAVKINNQSPLSRERMIAHGLLIVHALRALYLWFAPFFVPFERSENKVGYTAIRCVLARSDSNFGQKWHFRLVSTRV